MVEEKLKKQLIMERYGMVHSPKVLEQLRTGYPFYCFLQGCHSAASIAIIQTHGRWRPTNLSCGQWMMSARSSPL